MRYFALHGLKRPNDGRESAAPAQGGFGGNIDHDPCLLYTLSAVQILALLDRMDLLDYDAVANYVAGLQQPDGSFFGDEWGEVPIPPP